MAKSISRRLADSASPTGAIDGTLSTAAQTNITSVGTLSTLAVSGALTVDTNTLVVDSTNNRVGIGTSSPATLLDIKEGTGATDAIIGLTAGTGGRAQIRSEAQADNTSSELSFYTMSGSNTSEIMRISGSNVGIGTAAPTHGLTVSDANGGASATHMRRITIKSETHGANSGFRFDSESANGTARAGGYYFQPGDTDATTYVGLSSTDTAYQMVVTREGNVGIGTSTPDTTLHLQTPSGTKSEINFAQTAVTNYRIGVPASTDALVVTYGASTERMRIDSSGNVRIGGTATISNPYSQIPNFADVNLDGTWGGVISFKLGGVTKGWVGQRSSGNEDMVIGATAGQELLLYANNAEKVRITSDQIRVGVVGSAYTLSQFEVSALSGADRHSRSISSGTNSAINGSGQSSIMAEGVVAVNPVSAGTVLTIPHTSQTGLWRPFYVEMSFVTGEYNRSTGQNGGWAKVGYSVLNGFNGFYQFEVGGSVASVTTSGMNLLVNFSSAGSGFTNGTANYEGVCMHYKVMGITPQYFEAWNATLN